MSSSKAPRLDAVLDNSCSSPGRMSLLKDKIQLISQEFKSRLGLSSTEVSDRCPTVDTFFDAVAGERLRRMPRDGSRLDGVLRRASRFALAVGSLRDAVSGMMDGVDKATTLIWGSGLLLLENGMDNVDMLDSIFSRYSRVTKDISVLLQREPFFRESHNIQQEVALIYRDMLELVSHVTMEYTEGSRGKDVQTMKHNIDEAFFTHFNRFNTCWRHISETALMSVSKGTIHQQSTVDVRAIYEFIGLQDRPLQMILDWPSHTLADGSFGWFESHINNFIMGEPSTMVIMGSAGSGKSALAQWIVERLGISAEHFAWNVISYNIRIDVPITTLALSVLKGLLRQMLDQSVSNFKTQQGILDSITEAAEVASTGAPDEKVEEFLWTALQTGLRSELHFMLVIDGLEMLKYNGGSASFFSRLRDMTSGNNIPSKLIFFMRELPSNANVRNVKMVSMDMKQTGEDIYSAVVDAMYSHPQFQDIEPKHVDSIAREIVSRAHGSFVWAQLAMELVARQKTVADMVRAATDAPQSLGDLVDHHIHTMDLDQGDTRSLLAWLTAAERPLMAKEVQQLLCIDPKTPSLVSRLSIPEHDVFRPLSAVVSIRDGFVSFKHPIIRQYIRKRAGVTDNNLTASIFPVNLKEAHYDLLVRCVAWIKLSVQTEVPLRFDKLDAEQRESLFDSYLLMEYASRYWLSHLLSSSMATNHSTFIFTPSFRHAVPDSVLFSQVELTSRESQFSRSSILQLYRLAADVRRAVLGERSRATLQSLIFSSRAAHLAQADYANDHLYNAWTMSKSMMGPSSGISLALAENLASTPVHEAEWDDPAQRRTEALHTLIAMDWQKSPITFDKSLGYLSILVPMLKRNNQNDTAYAKSTQFYRRSVQQYGPHSAESAQAAEYLARNFPIDPTDDMAVELARGKYDTMARSMTPTDDRRIAYTLHLAMLYEDKKQPKNAEYVLSNLWGALSLRDPDSGSTWDKKSKVGLFYYQFLRRHGRDDAAEVILRGLSKDVEGKGVSPSDMFQRADTLRNEARDMHLEDLDKVLSILVWRVYKKSNQEYSPDAVNLARSLIQRMVPTNTLSNVSELSPQDRLLLHELIDSIASAGSLGLSTSTLVLCHNLAKTHIHAEQWRRGSNCTMSVLKHLWPTVENAQSESKFSPDVAPHMADIALDHAYCLFRRFNIHDATTVYGNAFKASIIAEKVAVPTLTAVVKTVVDFYERTFQFSKALALLHQVSEFFVLRLGPSNKHSIDTLYREGDLATRLEYRDEAEQSYNTIYRNGIQDRKIGLVGIKAAVALIFLYEQDKKWDAALEVYRHLWRTFVEFDEKDDHAHALLERMLEKTFLGYMAVLGFASTKAGNSERYQVASEHLKLCRTLYGPSHNMTMKATLSLAEICEDSDSRVDEGISLYQHVLNFPEWVPVSESSRSLADMSHSLPITLKHKLAQLYLRKKITTPEAGSLYQEELQLSKQQQGHSSSATLLWLREVALFYALADSAESMRKGSGILRSHVDEVIQTTDHHQTLVDRAHRLAEIYLECGYTEQGNHLIDQIHQQIVYEPPTNKALNDHPPAVFVAAFEEFFRGNQSYSQIMQQLSSESQMHGSFEKSLSSHDLVPTLAAGEQLYQLQTEQKRTSAANESRDKLYSYFCNSLSISKLKHRDVIYQFFTLCRREVQHDDYNINIIMATTNMVKDLCNRSQFQDAADLTGAFHSFVHLTEGLQSYESIFTSIKLCLYLNGYHSLKCPDEKTAKNMSFESKLFLQEIMTSAEEINIQLAELPFTELNDLVTVLGEHELWDDLESILTDLWVSRIVQKTWSPSVVVWIGRRLIETRFCRGETDAAIQLARDICYNLRHVWGNCDNVTLEMNKLLSGLYTASGNHSDAVSLHEQVLYELLNDGDAVNHPNATQAVSQHITLLKHAQRRFGKQATSKTVGLTPDTDALDNLTGQVATKFGLKQPDMGAEANENVGMWHRPRRFSLEVHDEEKHQNHLRNSSGGVTLTGNAGAKRISIAAL